jgi:hypothetical protein
MYAVDGRRQTCDSRGTMETGGGDRSDPGPLGRAPDPAAVRAALDRRLQVVAGKGGVGRTLLASALALRAARAGHRTLLLEVNAPDSAAAQLAVEPSIDEPREVLERLWLCRMTPAGALREYALLILKFKALYGVVFENRLVKYLLRSIPSLAEFTLLGKAWYHAAETLPEGGSRYDRIVIDAPATGHAITFLSVARTVTDVVPPGVMQVAAARMADLVESPTETCLHVVALPEEMPVNEGLDLVTAARGRLRMQIGLGVVNRVLPPLLSADERPVVARLEAAAATAPGLAPYVEATTRRLDREAWQASHAARFTAAFGRPVVALPELSGALGPRARVEAVIEALDRAAGGDHGRA